ncbi:MAG: hypothetical protein ABR956_06790 [Terracidiphilus sp.]|jgi:phenylacetate-CoA ligase
MNKTANRIVTAQLFHKVFYRFMSTPAHPRFRVNGLTREKQQLMRAPVEEISKNQAARMRDLLVHAWRHCDFYHERFASVGLTNESDLVIDNIAVIPTLSKKEIQENFEGLLSKVGNRKNWRENSSGGSTGQTVVLMQDPQYREESRASTFVSDAMQGWKFGNRTALLWGAARDTDPMMSLGGRVVRLLQNMRVYNSFDMGPEKMLQYHRDMEAYQPDNIIAYAGSAYLFAKFLLDAQLKPGYPRASIITSAETLTDDMRATIEECFGMPVYNRYGSREVGMIGTECSCHSGLHLHLDKYTETLDLECDEPVWGEPGFVTITLFSNWAMPLIRYKIGDVGILGRELCECGVNTPKFSKILGRSSDFIVSPSGNMIHGEYFTHVFYGQRNIRQFQFVQETPTSFKVRIVKDGELDPNQLDHIRKEIEEVLGEGSKIQFEFPAHIPPAPSGKFRFTISNVVTQHGG